MMEEPFERLKAEYQAKKNDHNRALAESAKRTEKENENLDRLKFELEKKGFACTFERVNECVVGKLTGSCGKYRFGIRFQNNLIKLGDRVPTGAEAAANIITWACVRAIANLPQDADPDVEHTLDLNQKPLAMSER